MELVRLIEPARASSPLAGARVQRQLTVEEAARRAGLTQDEITWLEEGRVYRFPTADHALIAALLYGTALGLSHREARALAGLPVPPAPPDANPLGRIAVLGGAVAAVIALLVTVVIPGLDDHAPPKAAAAHAVRLPPPWRIAVDVLNGSGDINYTRTVASRIGALGYRIERVRRADRFDYPQTAVYYEPGGQPLAVRLARSLGIVTKPLPGGRNPRRLVVIVGPQKGPG
jgi:transcriptional regulator with XRE-family HTH domain